MSLLKTFRNTIQKYRLLNKGDNVIIGVSGGPDSITLLYLLNKLKKEFRLSLTVVHVDHMLRQGSAQDAEFVSRLAAKLNLPLVATRIDVRRISKTGSIEERARTARFASLFKAARRLKADKIALGHNLDDQAETVLMRIIRGAGLYGLAAISPKRNICGHVIIRPLIQSKRKDIESYLRGRRLKCRRDPSNSNEEYFRNRVRNNLMPLLEKEYNCNIKDVLSSMAWICAEDYDYLLKCANAQDKHLGRKIKIKKFLGLHPAMQRLVLRLRIARLAGDTRRISFKHILEIQDLILSRPPKSIVCLPKGLSVVKASDSIFFCAK